MGSRTGGMLNSGVVGSGNGSASEQARTRRFGVFELDLRAGELRRSGLKVKLQDQPFQVLALLLETPGEIVTRDDLRNRLWPADTFVDFDHSLNAAIKRLRDALGDSAENPTFVETVARRGYRFLAPVSTTLANGNGSPVQPSATEMHAEPTPRPALHFHLWWIAAAAAVVLVLFGIKLGLSLAQSHAAAPLRVSQLTANPADDRVRAAAISHDGKYLAFSDQTGFYLRQIDTGETHSIPLPAGMAVESLSWFPDSAHLIVALNGAAQPPGLWEISTLGGTPRKLQDNGRAPAVSPDGKQIAFITGLRMRNQIWLMAADGEQPRKLIGEEGDFFGSLTWSPDGTRIGYIRGRLTSAFGVSGAIEFFDVRDQHVNSLLHLASAGWFSAMSGPLAWARDGRLIYALAEPPPRQLDSNLWSVGLDPGGHAIGTPLRLTNDRGSVSSISISADGKRIVYLKGLPQPDVYVAKVEGPAAISEPVRLTLDDRQDLPFDWTPDDKAVLFISDRTGMFSIYRQAIDQTVPELLVGGSHPVLTPRLSADGSQLLYLAYPSWTDQISSTSLMRMPLAGGAPQQVLQANWISNQQCARAPATECLYSVEKDDKFTLFSFDPLQGNATQVYQVKDDLPQAYNWSLSPDGTTLAIAKGKAGDEEPRIHLIALKSGADKWLQIQGRNGVGAIDWAADSKSLWASSAGEEEEDNVLLNIDLEGHARTVWRPRNESVYWAIPSHDGRYLALHVSSSSANVWMAERP
jgi:Tol biopolymer transport system component/DNA-binding winged helix-turn-helix (wHTH) protein